MRITRNNPKLRPAATGRISRLSGWLRNGGSGAPSPRFRLRRLAILPTALILATLAALALAASPAPAVVAPSISDFNVFEPHPARTEFDARVKDTNEVGTAEAATEFTTTAIGPPEIHRFLPYGLEDPGAGPSDEIGMRHANLGAEVVADGAETTYAFEYSTSNSLVKEGKGTPVPATPPGPIVAGAIGTEARLEGLAPETNYYLRLTATNHCKLSEPSRECTVSWIREFTTLTARPVVNGSVLSADPTNLTATSVTLHENVRPSESETHWRFEYATSESGLWTVGPSGVIAASEAGTESHEIAANLTGLSPATLYYFRFTAENEAGTDVTETNSEFGLEEYPGVGGFEKFPIELSYAPPSLASLETAGAPLASSFATHTFLAGSERLRILGSVTPNDQPLEEVQTVTVVGAPTGGTFTLALEGKETAPISFAASEREVERALKPLTGEAGLRVSGPQGGPYRVEFVNGGASVPQLTCNASALTPAGTCTVATVQDGSRPATHYHLQYVAQGRFEECGWSCAESTAELDTGPGSGHLDQASRRFLPDSELVAADLPLLAPGATYRYRVLAETPFGSVASEERTLTFPSTPESSLESCPNQANRTGYSAVLPDCRAYEQVTPQEKLGVTEIAHYGAVGVVGAKLVGEDGDHFLLADSVVKFGASPDSAESNFLFSRSPEGGWGMTSATPQPEAGVNTYAVRLRSPDLTRVALQVGWKTEPHESAEITLEAGPLGGPYATVAVMPSSQVPGSSEGGYYSAWVAASADFSKLVFWSEDRKLLPHHSSTEHGADLYEYSEGQVRQVNVDSAGNVIGSCGAHMAVGYESAGTPGIAEIHTLSSPNAISADGSRVFFETCTGLYMRVDGGQPDAETVDIGAYRFVGANSEGTELLLEGNSGAARQVLLYDTQTRTVKTLFSMSQSLGENHSFLSADFTDLYFTSEDQLLPEAPAGTDHLYRYDIATETLHLAIPAGGITPFDGEGRGEAVSPDGRYFYFDSIGVPNVPGGGHGSQVYRYDSVEGVVQCISCASPFDPEPGLESTFLDPFESDTGDTVDRMPNATFASANGDYVFFDTPSALLPSDIDGEIPPSEETRNALESHIFSPSSDVYEWRKDGVDGCAHAQGCLSLISSGQGGFKVMLLGTDPSGENVFFTSASQLGPNDHDSALDIYDARIDGGEPPAPPSPVECEADACSTPASAPADATPSSLTFSGLGNLTPPAPRTPKVVKAKSHKKKVVKHKRRSKRKLKKKARSVRRATAPRRQAK